MADILEDHRTDKDSVHDYSENIVKIIVGKEQKVFYVHETVLRQQSDFFETALKKEWQEGQQKEVQLPEEDSDSFSRLLGWLYTRDIACKKPDSPGSVRLAKLYALGERLLASKFQNAVADAFIVGVRKRGKRPSCKVGSLIYDGTPIGSPGRKLMVDIRARFNGVTSSHEGLADANHEFLVDLVKALSRRPALGNGVYEQLMSGTPEIYHKSRSIISSTSLQYPKVQSGNVQASEEDDFSR